ncbi:hypothetical protein N1F78_11630 [Seonamhaeicola sp. MEBiC1930]|uniref:hypothetical protein n=1 Tax=Seonamhaeicola sp. MEBiC01930 TaxID=2976768 RepID=UPI00324C2F49
MIIIKLPKQKEIQVLPVYTKLSEIELENIALENQLDKYEVKEHETFKCVNRTFEFEYYSYTFKYN